MTPDSTSANDWLLQVAAEHETKNLVSPLAQLLLSEPMQTLRAAAQCESFLGVLPEIVARNLIPRSKIIEAFRRCREKQTDRESAEAARGLDEILALRHEMVEEERSRHDPKPIEDWMTESGLTAEAIVDRLYDAGLITLEDLYRLFNDEKGKPPRAGS
jgi:hypothetical protein